MDKGQEQFWRERPLSVRSTITAEHRGWSGFTAALVEVDGGASQPKIFARHNITMMVGSPLRTTVISDGLEATRDQTAGTFDLLPANSSATWIDRGSSTFVSAGIEWGLMRETATAMGIDPESVSFERIFTCRDPQIEHLLWALKAELEIDAPSGRLYADSLGIALASQMLRRWCSAAPKMLSGSLSHRKLKEVLAYIEESLEHDITLADIADVVGLSPSRFGAVFKQAVGTSVHRYVVRRRVQRAIELLSRTQLPLCDVALQTGFANQSHMGEIVRRYTGTTPQRIRDAG